MPKRTNAAPRPASASSTPPTVDLPDPTGGIPGGDYLFVCSPSRRNSKSLFPPPTPHPKNAATPSLLPLFSSVPPLLLDTYQHRSSGREEELGGSPSAHLPPSAFAADRLGSRRRSGPPIAPRPGGSRSARTALCPLGSSFVVLVNWLPQSAKVSTICLKFLVFVHEVKLQSVAF